VYAYFTDYIKRKKNQRQLFAKRTGSSLNVQVQQHQQFTHLYVNKQMQRAAAAAAGLQQLMALSSSHCTVYTGVLCSIQSAVTGQRQVVYISLYVSCV